MRHGRTILIPALILGTLIFPALTIAPVRAQEKADEGPANEKAQKTYKEALGYLQRRMKDAALDGFKEFFRDLDLFPGEATFFGTPAFEVYGKQVVLDLPGDILFVVIIKRFLYLLEDRVIVLTHEGIEEAVRYESP